MAQVETYRADTGLRSRVQMLARAAVEVIYPPRCIGCGDQVQSDFGLCPSCWRDTPFIVGTVCDSCGAPLPGEADGTRVECDGCLSQSRPWRDGRSVMLYRGQARKLVLGLKHGDRPEVAKSAAPWLERVARPLLRADMVIAPVPLHWTRLWRRRYNQSALLARGLGNLTGLEVVPDLLARPQRTTPQDGKSLAKRFEDMDGAIRVHPNRRHLLRDRPVLLVDDVFTSGATFTASTKACLSAGSGDVFVLALARAVRDD